MRTVLHVRPGGCDGGLATAVGEDVSVRQVAPDDAVGALDDVDVACVVVERGEAAGDALAVVETVRDHRPDLPVLCASDDADGAFAAAATRRGATEYVARDASDWTLADRVSASLPAGSRGPSSAEADGGAAGGDASDVDGSTGAVHAGAGDRNGGVRPGEWPSVTDRDGVSIPEFDGATRQSTGSARSGEVDWTRALLDAVEDGLYVLDTEGRFVAVNEAMTTLTGYAGDELVGARAETIADDASVARARDVVRSFEDGTAATATFRTTVVPRSAEPFPAEDHMTRLAVDGEFVGCAGVLRDVTDRVERERRLRETRERFADLLETSRTLLGTHGRENVAAVVADATAEILGFDAYIVRLYDEDADRLEPVTGSGDVALADESGTDAAIDIDDRPGYAPGDGGPGTAFATGEILRYPADFEPGEVNHPAAMTETLYVPLGEEGVLSVGAVDAGGFDDLDVSLAEILASNAAVALERVAYEAELLQYRTVLENVQDMVYVVDSSERFSLVTAPLAEWLGYDREELAGMDPSKALAPDAIDDFESVIADLWHGEGAETSDAAAAVEGAETVTIETEFVTAEGERLPAAVDVSLLPGDEEFRGTVGVVRDRSELVETREKLAAQRDRFSYLFDNLPDAVVEGVIDEDGRPVLTAVNRTFTDVFGYDEDTVVGDPIDDYVVPPGEQESAFELDDRTAAGETVQAEVRRKTAVGYRDFLFRGVPYDTNDDRLRGFGIYTDITEQKERERRLEVLNRVLRHNLRNDLNVVLGYAELLANRASDDDLAQWAEILHRKATDVATLGDRVRTLDRQTGRGTLRDDSVDLASVVDDVVATYREESPDATIETDVDAVDVIGDSRLGLAISELVDNCVAYCGDDVEIRIASTSERDRVLLTVTDDGPGIPEREQAVVSGSVEITQLDHGSGLGLWIVKWVCEACGGRVRFEESSLGGAAVTLSLTPADGA